MSLLPVSREAYGIVFLTRLVAMPWYGQYQTLLTFFIQTSTAFLPAYNLACSCRGNTLYFLFKSWASRMGRICSGCHQDLSKSKFSSKQWAASQEQRRCKVCTKNNVSSRPLPDRNAKRSWCMGWTIKKVSGNREVVLFDVYHSTLLNYVLMILFYMHHAFAETKQ